jgi:hypothetical protein
MRRTAAHLHEEANRLAAVATNLIATGASLNGDHEAADAWVASGGVRRGIIVDLDHIITHALALRHVFAEPADPPPPLPPETNTEPRSAGALDERVAEAMQTIGSIVEHDLGVPYATIAGGLITLAQITRNTGRARYQREMGNIGLASRIENNTDRLIGKLPAGAAW